MLLTSLIIGFLWGTLISVCNYLYLQWVTKKNADKTPQQATLAVVNAHFLRYFMNIAALFVVYRHMWVLVGTAVGLTTMNAVTVIKYYREGRQQIAKTKRLKKAAKASLTPDLSPETDPPEPEDPKK